MSASDEEEERKRQERERSRMSFLERLYGSEFRTTASGFTDGRSLKRTGRVIQLPLRVHPRIKAMLMAIVERDKAPSMVVLFEELALWMLERMRDSEEFLGVIRAARTTGSRDVLDTPNYVARHQGRLKKLYQSDSDDTEEAPAALASLIDEIVARDMLSGREELLEKALKAYLDSHPKGAEGLPAEWQTTFDAARTEIEGKTHGAFEPGFVAGLAAAARREIEQQAARDQSRNRDRDR